MASIKQLDHDPHNGADYADYVRILSITVWDEPRIEISNWKTTAQPCAGVSWEFLNS